MVPHRLFLKAALGSAVTFAGAHYYEGYINKQVALGSLVGSCIIGTVCFRLHPEKTVQAIRSSLLGSCVVHVDIPHLVSNLSVLTLCWDSTIKQFGVENSLALFVNSALLTSSMSRYLNNPASKFITLGSSGAVAAILTATLWQKDVGPILAPAGSIALILVTAIFHIRRWSPQLDHINHLVGMSYGAMFGCCYRYLKGRKKRTTNTNNGD